MRRFYFIFLLLSSVAIFQSKAQCVEITSILVDACVDNMRCPSCVEEENEMFTFQVGNTPIDINNLNVTWPNFPAFGYSFNGWCANPAKTLALNATITSTCGVLIEPPLGVIPASANVIVITSENIQIEANSFDGLSDTLYILYQCAGNTGGGGHFRNGSGGGPTTTRDLQLTYTGIGTCVSNVSYIPNDLLGIGDGDGVNFDGSGVPSYFNYGCTAPVSTRNANWEFTDEICNDYGNVDLISLLASNATTGGNWSGLRVTDSTYNPAGYLGLDSIKYTVPPSALCLQHIDSTIVFNVVEPQTEVVNFQSCDSVLVSGTWVKTDTSFLSTINSTNMYSCDSFVNNIVTIDSASKDSIYFFVCDSIQYKGTWHSSDTIIRDTVLAGGGGMSFIDTILKTSFENNEGWTDQSTGNWTLTDAYGTWTGNDMYANQFNPNTGIRNVGMNDVGDWLEFPLIDKPQTLYYFDRLSAAVTGTNEFTIQYFDGLTWVNIASDTCTHSNYERVVINLSVVSSLTNVRIRILRTQDSRSGYIDDIVITGSTANISSNCDSITIISIDIAEPVVFDTIFQCTLSLNGVGTVNDTTQYTNGWDSLITSTITTFIDTNSIYTFNCTNNPTLIGNDTTSIISSSSGCDSIYNITVTNLVDTSFEDSTITICDSLIYNGTTYYSDTTFTDTTLSTLGCDSIYKEVNIIAAPNFSKTMNPVICQGDSFQLEGDGQFVFTTGTYTSNILVPNNCDTTVTTNLLVENPSLSISQNVLICLGEKATLNATGTQNILWNTGETSNQINVLPLANTTYTVQGKTANGCTTSIDSIHVNIEEPITNVSIIASNQEIQFGESVEIEVSANNVQNYFWTPTNSNSSSITDQPKTSTSYIVELRNEPCPSVLDSILITVKQPYISIPTGFSPNSDGINDLFLVLNYEDFETYTIKIYNKWGELVFENTDFAAAWDGTYKGRKLEIGVYTYYIEAKSISNQKVFKEKGNITLIR